MTVSFGPRPAVLFVDSRRLRPSTRSRSFSDCRRLLEETSRAWREGCQLAADIGWRNDARGKRRLQSLAYDRIREETGLGSMHATLAIHQAVDALSAVAALEERGQSVSKPEFTSPTIRYNPKMRTSSTWVFDSRDRPLRSGIRNESSGSKTSRDVDRAIRIGS